MPQPPRYRISVQATPHFLTEESDPSVGRYLFTYTVTLVNEGSIAAQLISRHWIITDADEDVQEVRGSGVVGQQPLLQPGDRYEYTSGCPLPTPVGTMRGSFRMLAADGTHFDAEIPEFALAMPGALH